MKMIFALMAALFTVSASAAALSPQRSSIEITAEAGAANAGAANAKGYYRVDFGTVFVHQRQVQRFTLRNTGTVPLTFRDAYVSGSDFAAYHGCRNGLLPNESCPFEIEYSPFFEGFSSGRFDLNFFEDQITFDLFGRAQRM